VIADGIDALAADGHQARRRVPGWMENIVMAARSASKHTSVPEGGTAMAQVKPRRRKVMRKVKVKPAPAPPPAAEERRWEEKKTDGGDEWGELAERAARKVREMADKAMPHAEKAGETAKKVAVDLSSGLDDAFATITAQARDLMAKGQHTRVRIKFRGKQIAELPIAVVAAAEVASLWWLGPLRLVLGHVVGKAVLDVEFVSNADQNVAAGRAFLADGELEKAAAEFEKALAMDRRHAGALLGKGIALKLKDDKAGARECFERAEEADPRGEPGREARRHLDNL
jgi:tetratricopeptide (TPR) repeat protein